MPTKKVEKKSSKQKVEPIEPVEPIRRTTSSGTPSMSVEPVGCMYTSSITNSDHTSSKKKTKKITNIDSPTNSDTQKNTKKNSKKPIGSTIPVEKTIKKVGKKLIKEEALDLELDTEEEDLTEEKNKDDFEEKMYEIREKLRKNYLEQKKLMNDLRELSNLHKKELKLLSKNGPRKNISKFTGFNKPQPVPESLRTLLKLNENDQLPRSKVTSLLYKYFTDNKMYNKNTKKEILPNDKIRKIFGMKKNDTITFYNLQTWLRKLYDETNEDGSDGNNGNDGNDDCILNLDD